MYRSLLIVPMILAGGLAACSAPPAYAPIASEPTTIETPAPQGPELNSHGLIPKQIGEAAGILFPGTEQPAVELKILSVERQFVCTGTYTTPPENGEFIALNVEVATSPDYLPLAAGQPMRFFWQDFLSYESPGGPGIESPPTWVGCVPEEEAMPLDIPAGQVTTGKLFLDAPPSATSFSWVPSTFTLSDVGGWEWPLP